MSGYTIIATLGDHLERIIEADFLNNNELKIVEDVIVPLFKACDDYDTLSNSMSASELFNYESENGLPEMVFPYPYFIFDNQKHKELLALLKISGIGIWLSLNEIPNIFERNDTINLLKGE